QCSQASGLRLTGGQFMDIDRHSTLTQALQAISPVGRAGWRNADRPKAGQFRRLVDVEIFMILRPGRWPRGERAIGRDDGTWINRHRARDGVRRSLRENQLGKRAALADPR